MPEGNQCPQCGTPLAAEALANLCPACLLKQWAATETRTDARQSSFVPPTIAELAPLFPQLEILELIGKGGMGAVYKARQKQLDRIVALKILPPGSGSDPAFAERFMREAKALAKLNHPGIVTLFEFGRTDQPLGTGTSQIYFFLMEFVDGVNLRQLLLNGRIATREALAIVPQICDALQFAHDQGIVHRDIKPENILLDRRGRVKVADFGLAKIIGGDIGAESSADQNQTMTEPANPTNDLTEANKVMGTPQYMSPEQTQRPGEVDHRADIYALGVVFYQMLTGELPGKKIEPPSKKVQIDVRLDEIVLRALEKKPELRFQQASVLKTQVETIASEKEKAGVKHQAPAIKPRFSRTALAGGAWFLLLAACFILENIHLRTFFLGPLGLLAPLGTTVLGWIAITQIRQSAGKLRGMWLAVLDGLLFPLLALDAAIFGLIGLLIKLLGRLPYFAPPGDGGMSGGITLGYQIAMLFCLWLGAATLISMVADFFIIRSVWRVVNKTPEETEASILSSVKAWLALMDAGDYAQTWETAAPLFRQVVSETEWAVKCEKVRQPLGKILLRDLRSARFTAAGKCFKAIFTVQFDNGLDAVETVTFIRQADRNWRAITYIIRLSRDLARDWKRAFWINFFVMSAVVLVLAVIGISVTTAVNFFTTKKSNPNYAISPGNELALRAKVWQTPHPEPTRVRQPASAPFVAQLPDGGSVELLAVRLPSLTNQPWWQPDGSPSAYGSNVELENKEHLETGVTALARVHFPKTQAHWPLAAEATNPPTVDLGTGVGFAVQDGRRMSDDANQIDTMFGVMSFDQVLAQGDKTTLFLKVAMAGWNTLATQKPGWFDGVFSGPGRKEWSFSETPTGNLKVTITHLSENPGMEYRLIAVDLNGTQYVPSQTKRTKTSTEISMTLEAEFEPVNGSGESWQLPLKRVREVRWEARPYEMVEFRNVSLQPGHQTTVEVKDFGEEIKPDTRVKKFSFSPVSEQVMMFDAKGLTDLLDLDSGKIIGPQTDVAKDLATLGTAAGISFTSAERMMMATSSLGLQPVENEKWDSSSADMIKDAAETIQLTGVISVENLPEDKLPKTYLFKTRKGGMGLLQIISFNSNPPGVKMRYKLVQPQTITAPYSYDWMQNPDLEKAQTSSPVPQLRSSTLPANASPFEIMAEDSYEAHGKTLQELIKRIWSQKNSAMHLFFAAKLPDDKFDFIAKDKPRWWNTLESEIDDRFHLTEQIEIHDDRKTVVIREANAP